MTNAISITRIPGRDDRNYHHPTYYNPSVGMDESLFPSGRYSASVSVFDGTFSTTQNYPEFEVISPKTAVQEFLAALERQRGERAGRMTLALLEAYRRAEAKERGTLAEKRWKHFQRQLGRVISLSEEERARIVSAAEQVRVFL